MSRHVQSITRAKSHPDPAPRTDADVRQQPPGTGQAPGRTDIDPARRHEGQMNGRLGPWLAQATGELTLDTIVLLILLGGSKHGRMVGNR